MHLLIFFFRYILLYALVPAAIVTFVLFWMDEKGYGVRKYFKPHIVTLNGKYCIRKFSWLFRGWAVLRLYPNTKSYGWYVLRWMEKEESEAAAKWQLQHMTRDTLPDIMKLWEGYKQSKKPLIKTPATTPVTINTRKIYLK